MELRLDLSYIDFGTTTNAGNKLDLNRFLTAHSPERPYKSDNGPSINFNEHRSSGGNHPIALKPKYAKNGTSHEQGERE
jgi:hypothetical protein